MDETDELEQDSFTVYQELIGEPQLVIKIDIFDILHELSVIFLYQAAPHDRHLQQILHVFAFLMNNSNLTLQFDPNPAIINPISFTGITVK